MPRPLSEFQVLSFDCYGTLIDWEQGIAAALEPLLRTSRGAAPSRAKALRAFARHEHAQEAATPGMPYEQVLAAVHRALAQEFGLQSTAQLDQAFGGSIPQWPAFPDSPDALRLLAQHYKLVILSNVSRAGIEASVERLGVSFDAILTAEAIGSYKPDRANFRALVELVGTELGTSKEGVLHVAQSLFHDHVPARAEGLANVWIDRQRLSEGGDFGATTPVAEQPEIDYRFFTLAEFASAL